MPTIINMVLATSTREMSEEDSMAIEFSDLADVYSQEKGSNAITRLPDDFYRLAVSYIKATFARIENSRLDIKQVPDKEAVRATGEYQRSREVLESIYNTRERKIVLAALNASRGIEQRTDNMTEEEKDLFFILKVELETKRDRVIRYDRMLVRPPIIRPETGIDTNITEDFAKEEPAPTRIAAKAKDIGAALLPNDPACIPPGRLEAISQRTGVDMKVPEGRSCLDGYQVVRALVDIGAFALGDGLSVNMALNDMATLPVEIAKALVGEGMAEVMEGPN
jgi:hypothetical protein